MALLTWAEELWLFSIMIATVSLSIMVALVIGRLVSGALRQGREEDRQRSVKLVLGQAVGDAPHLLPGSKANLVETATELIRMVRGSDREAFIERAEGLGIPALLRHRLDSGSPRVRVAAAEALSQFPDDRTIERLTLALGDSSPPVRLSAALSLAATNNAPRATELVEKLGIGTRENSRLAVALFRDIGRVRPGEIRDLIGAPDVPAGAKAAAVEALAASGDYQLVPMIAELVIAAPAYSPELPRYLRALADFGHPAAEPAVRAALDSPGWEARAAAARAAGRIGLATLGPKLRKLLGDSEWWVRFRAAEALARLGDPGVRLLKEAANDAAEPARTTAALTLSERGLA